MHPGSWGEQYALENEYEYVYVGANGAVEVTVDPEVYRGMQLVLTCGNTRRVQTISDQNSYTFTGLSVDSTCTVQIRNAYGDIVAQAEDLTVTGSTSVTLEDVLSLGTVSVVLLDENGSDITSAATVEWYGADNEPYASGASLRGLAAGTTLRCRIRLSEQYGQTHQLPEDFVHIVKAGEESLTIRLIRIPTVILSGTVTGKNGALAGASVVVSQTVNGKYSKHTTVLTDKDGRFSAAVLAVGAQMTVSARGCLDQTVALENLSGSKDLGTLTLTPVTGAMLTISAAYIHSALQGETARTETLTDLNDLEFAVYNKTQNASVETVLRQDMMLVLADHASAGDRLEVTVSSLKGDFQPTVYDVTLEKSSTTNLLLELKQSGSIIANFSGTDNEAIRALIYHDSGNLVWSGSAKAAALSVTSGVLADGSYTVVMMGRSSFLDDPNSLEGLRLAGMMEGTDYVKRQVRVTSGLITVCEFDTVPLLDETRFYYTAPDVTGYTTSKTSITAGKFFTLRASAAFTEEYEGRISDVKWIFELPEGTEYYEGTLTLGGTGGASCEYSGNVLTVPTEDPAQIVRFCVNAIGQGDVRSAAYLEFICDGQLIRQPVGTVNVKISALDFEVTEKTYEPSVTVTGTASGNAEILVYDNDILVGQTQSNPNGSWQLTFDLYKPGTYTEHRIYAVMRLSTGTQVRSVTHSVIYQYAPNPVSVSTVTMFFGDSSNPAAVFDFKDPQIRGMAYTVVGGETFTFLVDFHCEDDSLLSDVSLELKLTDGSTRSLKTVYDEAMGGFVTSSTFSFDALPVNVSVGYVYDGELVFSQEHLAEVEAEIAELEKAVDELDTIPEEDIEALFAPIVLDFNSEVEVPEELTRAVADYNAALSEYQAYAKELSALMEELYGEIEVSQNKLTTDSELFQSSFEQRTLAEFSVADKVAEGYSVYLVGEGTEEMVLVRITTDTEAGCVEYSVIDATDDGSGIARMARNPQAARELPKDLVIEAIPAKKGEMYISSAGYKGPVISNPPEKIQITFEDMAMVQGAMGKAFAMMEDARLATSYGLELYAASQSAWCEKISKELAALPSNSIEATVVKQRLDLELAEKNGIKLSLENSKMLEKTFDVVGKVATGVGAIFDYSNLQKEALKCGNLIYAANTTNNPEIVEAMYQQFFKTYTLGVISIGNVVWGEKLKVDSIPVSKIPGCNTLLAFVDTIVDDIIFKDVNDNIDRVYEKYSGNNASGSGEPMRPIIDPSGYIYEAVASNRLQGVTVTCYEKVTKYDIYDEAYTEISMWDAEEFDQRNPLTTDALGQYSWDVPTGWWRVKAELEGYETTYSEWLPVPPPQLEVNLGLVSYEAPVVQSIDAAPDAIEITFSKYMRAELLTAGNITVSLNGTRVAGELTLVNGEENPLNTDEIFASIVRFVPETEIANGSEITVTVSDKLVSYADVTLVGSKSQKATVIARPDTFIADATSSEVDYLGNGTVTIQALPADLAAGQTVQVAAGSGTLLQVEESTVVLDANGCAEVHITGKLPGETEITFTLSGTKLKARTVVTILMPEIPDCTHKNLATDSVREITQCQNNGDSRTHYCVGTETFRLYCQDCGEYISGVHQGVTYPYIQRIDGDYSHEFLDGICTDCGYESHILLGDANDDGTINNIDAMLILQYAVGLKNQADLAYAACDVNGDNMVNNIDAMLVLQYAVGLITVFPGGTA